MKIFTAKEPDNETNYTYFGARYYDSELSGWLSVDPMIDKYPSLSPYCYSADYPIILKDTNGEKVYIVGDAADEATGFLIKKPYKFSQLPYNKPSSIHNQINNNK